MTAAAAVLLLLGCDHGDAFEAAVPFVGPSGPGPDVRLTYNTSQDYWPVWTEDGRGILYSFIRPDTAAQHRCLGLLPAAGGGTTWQFCDDRATQVDSVSSFTAYALGSDGRLLYVEAIALRGVQSSSPAHTTLWLADTAAPLQRRALLTLPMFASGISVSWLADISWTGATTFVALAQDFSLIPHCKFCGPFDSIFTGRAVVRGSITAAGATLAAVPGTEGATSYSLAENGATIAFTLRDDRRLFKVAASGGSPTAIAIVSPATSAQLLGVSCKGATCVVADDPVTLTAVLADAVVYPSIGTGATELRAVSLATGVVQILRTTAGIVATPQISPVTGDVVAQVGGLYGHLQTATTSGSDLHLYLGLVQ